MTAAYMTRCVYLTFHGEYRGAHAPHEILDVDEAEHDPIDTPASVAHDAEVHAPHESNRLITDAALGAVVLRDLRRAS